MYISSPSPQYVSICTKRTEPEPTQEDAYNYIFRDILNPDATYDYLDDYLSICTNAKTKKLINHIRTKLNLSNYGTQDDIENLIIENITVLTDYATMSSNYFLQTYTYEKNYTIYSETDLEFNNLGYHKFSDDEEYYRLHVNFRKDANGKTKVVKYVNGQHRRKRFLKECNLICKINSTIGFDELLFNAVYRRHYFYDNSDNVMTDIWLINTVIESYCCKDYKIENSRHPKLTTSKLYCMENGLNRKGYSRTCQKWDKYNSIGEWYDCGLSVQENFRIAKDNGWYDGCLNTLRNFCKEYAIDTDPGRKQDISDWYDREKSVKENLEYARKNGIKVGRTKLYEYQRKLRSGL